MPHDLIIVVPGITGSVLAREGKPLWDLSVAALRHGALHTGEVLAELALPEVGEEGPPDGLEAVGLIEGWHIWPGLWKGAGYGALVQRLRRAAPGRVLEFAYDWRLSNAYSARRLRDFTERALADRPGARVVFVCHSMGGLIARYYLEVLGGRDIAAQMISIGTPYSGSVKAIRALAGGLVPFLGRLDERLVEVARTFPSIAELLPAYRCVQRGNGEEPRLLHGTDVPDLPSAQVRRGRDFHDRLSAALAANGEPPYELQVFAGKLQPTDQSVLVANGRVTFQRHQRGDDFGGDGTVPAFSAVPPEWETTAGALYRAARHAPLTKHLDVLDDVADKVNALPLRGVLAPPHELGLDLPDTVTAAEPVPLTVHCQAGNLRLQATVRDLDGHVVDSRIPVRPGESGRLYRASVPLPAGTWHLTVEEVAGASRASVDDLVTVL